MEGEGEDVDVFKEVPTLDEVHQMLKLYADKQKNVWATEGIVALLDNMNRGKKEN